jgi:hypothetical protein
MNCLRMKRKGKTKSGKMLDIFLVFFGWVFMSYISTFFSLFFFEGIAFIVLVGHVLYLLMENASSTRCYGRSGLNP